MNYLSAGVTTTEPDNTCASQPCENNGTCIRLPEAFVCQCVEGYIGLRCETHESDQGEYNKLFAIGRELW